MFNVMHLFLKYGYWLFVIHALKAQNVEMETTLIKHLTCKIGLLI